MIRGILMMIAGGVVILSVMGGMFLIMDRLENWKRGWGILPLVVATTLAFAAIGWRIWGGIW